MNTDYKEVVTKVLDQWKTRAAAQELKPGSKKYVDRRLEYLIGASACWMATTGSTNAWPVLILACVGRPTADLYPTPVGV